MSRYQVSNRAAAQHHWSPSEGYNSQYVVHEASNNVLTAHEESERDELTHVCGNCSSDGEDNEQEVAAVVQWESSVHFR